MRSQTLSDWLAASDWAAWERTALTGDASARRYERLIGPNGQTAILMDADPATCGSQRRFVEIAAHLRSQGLQAPDVWAFEEALGFLVLSDLGSVDFAKHLTHHPADERILYEAAVDVLIRLHAARPADGLHEMTADVGTQMVDLAFDWAATDTSPDLHAEIKTHLHTLLTETAATPAVMSLRDFHAENLIWRKDQTGDNRVGLLDFQDAFLAHPMYDLASLLRDARRGVDDTLVAPLIARLAGGQDVAAATQAFHVIALQRNLRILGIFNRLARRDGKAHYLAFIPRVWDHIQSDLSAPQLAHLGPLVTRALAPKET